MAKAPLSQFTAPLETFVLIGATKSLAIEAGITGAQLELSMEGPSVLTIDVIDTTYSIVRDSGVMGTTKKSWSQVTTPVGGINWKLSECEKTEDGWTFTFYDAASAILKDRHGAWKAARNKLTRAQAAQALCRKAGVEFAEQADTDKKQPIEKFTKSQQQQIDDAKASDAAQSVTRPDIGRGALNGKGITIKGAKATREQVRNLETIMRVADQVGAKLKARQAMIVAAIGESSVTAIPNGAGSAYGGVFQGNVRDGVWDINDTAGMAEAFLKGGKGFQAGGAVSLANQHPEYSAGDIAIRVEGGVANFSGDYALGAAFYNKHFAEAQKIINAWAPGSEGTFSDDVSLTGTPDRVRFKKYEFRVQRNESFFKAMDGWAQDVTWRFFVVAVPEHPDGIAFFVSDPTLAAATPSMVVDEAEEGIDRVLWKVTRRGRIDSITVNCRLATWSAQQGQAVIVDGEGPTVDGVWLVRTIERDLLDTSGQATITLGKPQQPKPEPAPDVQFVQGSDPDVDADTFTGKKATVAKAYAKAVAIDKLKQHYSYGGGHNGNFSASADIRGTGVVGYDCSGMVSAVLHAAGLLDTVLDTVALGQWGKPGRGKFLTVWVRPYSGMQGHTWLWFEDAFTGKGIEIFEAGGTSGLLTGRRSEHSTDGFEARHWEGL